MIYNKAEMKYLRFEQEFDLNDCCINFANEHDVDLSNYQTDESKIKDNENDQEWFKFSDEHLKICKDPFCVDLVQFRKENKV